MPVLWLPALWVRTGREPGLLPPRIELRGEQGLLVGGDVFLPLGTLDVQAGAAVQTNGPAETRGSIEADEVWATVTAREDGAVSAGALALPHAVARWDLASNGSIRPRIARDIEAATVRPRVVEAFATADGDALTVSSGLSLRQTDPTSGLHPVEWGATPALSGALPSLAATAGPLLLAGRAILDARVRADRFVPSDTLRASLGPGVSIGLPLAPLRLLFAGRVEATGWRGPLLDHTTAARIATAAGAALSLPLERSFGSVLHELIPALTASWTGLALEEGPPPPRLDDLEAIVPGARVELSLRSRLTSRSGRTALFAESGGLIAPDDLRLLFTRLQGVLGPLETDTNVALDLLERDWSLEVGGTLRPGPFVIGLGYVRLTGARSLLSDQRPYPGELATRERPVVSGELGATRLGLQLWEAWSVSTQAWIDLDAEALAGIDGSLVWSPGCRCLSVAVSAAQWAGRRWPDVHLLVTLAGVPASASGEP